MINLMTEKSTLSEELGLYANRLSANEVENRALQALVWNLQEDINNLKAEFITLKRSGHYGGAGVSRKYRGRPRPKCKSEGQSHHPTWWSTPYFWGNAGGNHSRYQLKRKDRGHKSKETSTTILVGIAFGLLQGLWWLRSNNSNNNVTHNDLNSAKIAEL